MGHEEDRAEIVCLKARVDELERLLKAQQPDAASQAGRLAAALQQVHDQAAILRTIVASTSAATGAEFFRALVTSLASTLGVRCAFVGEVIGTRPGHMHTLALWLDGGLGENFDYALAGTPCEHIVTGRRMLVFPRGIRQQFPDDRFLADAGLESYMGFPLFDEKGGVMGLVGVMHDAPMTEDCQAQSLLEVYASRVETELRRLRLVEALRENEEKYRLLFSRAMDAVALIDVDTYRLLDVNDVALGMYGYSRDEFLRLRVSDISAEPTKSLAAIRHAAETGGAYIQLRWHKKKDGTVFPVEISCGSFTWKGRTVICGVVRDITERRRAEEALQESTLWLQAILDHSPAMVFLKDTEGRYLLTNRRFEQAFHLTREAVIGKTDHQLFPPEQAAAFVANDRQVLRSGMPLEFEEVARHDDGPHTSIVVKFPLYSEKGEVYAIGGITTDITERKRFEEALQRSEAGLAEAQRIACLGNWDWDIVTNELHWSDEIYRIFGLVPKQFGATYEAFLNCVHPGDRAFVQRSVQDALVNDAPYNIDHRIQLADGTVRMVHEQAEVTRNEGGRPVRMVGTVQDVTERKRAEEERKHLAAILEATTDFVGTADRNGRALFVNQAGRRLLGIGEAEDITDALIPDFHPDWAARLIVAEGLPTAVRDGVWSGETALRTREGLEIPVSQVILSHKTPEGEIAYFSTIARDLRDRKHLEDQLRQAAKMEAVGRLAGGIAHDFNNLLTVITGHSDLLLRRLADGDPSRKHADEIKKAGRHAANLTGQLLAFGRRQVTQPKVLDLNGLVADMAEMLRRLIGENVRLVTDLPAEPCPVKADPDQLAQVLMNLAVNARDAMPEGGTLTLETLSIEGEIAHHSGRAGLAPGPYVKLTVRDTGCGMDAETKTHIFEPFFTTKDRLKGTGLGLAMVYGIIAQHGGAVAVDSVPGQGAAFTIYLPRASGAVETAGEPERQAGTVSGSETILLVEDDQVVRTFVRDLLVECGYDVVEAAGAEEALRWAERHQGPIHLLLTDVIMPGLSGRQLAERIGTMRPDTKILFMSGYTGDIVIRYGLQEMGVEFIQKPFDAESLERKVRALLDAHRE